MHFAKKQVTTTIAALSGSRSREASGYRRLSAPTGASRGRTGCGCRNGRTSSSTVCCRLRLPRGWPDRARRMGVSKKTSYGRPKQYAGLQVNDERSLRHLQEEKRALKREVADFVPTLSGVTPLE